MLLNDTTKEIKMMLAETGEPQAAIARKMGVSAQYVGRVIKHNTVVSSQFITLLEAMGYDVKIEYIRK